MKKVFVLSLVALTVIFQFGCKSAPTPAPVPEEKATGPLVLSVSYTPEYFSPDGDGEDDQLSITLGVKGDTEVVSWTFDIMQPVLAVRQGQQASIFKHFEGSGAPGEVIIWDGRSDPRALPARRNADGTEGEARQPRAFRVESATDYPYIFKVTGADGIVSELSNGVIHVDILVIKEDDGRLRVQVPSIVFRANAADFKGLPERTVTNNERVISRIAASLNKFPDYKVSVEGHANPENAPGTSKRTAEEQKESQKGNVSEKRAEAIVDLLIADKVAKARLSAVGLGISKPIVEFDDTDNLWRNRRVEFYLSK
jgi:flagellar motor protein MotB